MIKLLDDLRESLERGEERILCQVLETRGSTPQKAGAIMVVNADGEQWGTLGGGCVENEVKQKAIRRFGQMGAELHSFVLDHDYAWADGLICGGRMKIIAEAVQGPDAVKYFEVFARLAATGAGFTEAAILNTNELGIEPNSLPLGGRILFGPQGTIEAVWPTSLATSPAVAQIQPEPLEARPRPYVRQGLSFMPTLPRIRLVIVGAGHVGQAVAELAAKVDFDVWVIDDRRQYANPDRFPDANRILVGPIEDILKNLEVTPHTYALIVTRGHGHDQEALYHLAPTPAAYVGLIGSHRKIKMILESLRGMGVPEQSLTRVTAPIGLEIGSQTVPEIAVSIVAQLIAKRNLEPRSKVPTNKS